MDLVDHGETEGDGCQNEEKTQPRKVLFGLRYKGKEYQKEREEDIEPPLYGQGIRLPIEAPEGCEQVLGEGGKTPERERLGVALNDMKPYQQIVDQQNEEVVGKDA